ncbi:lymphotactin-like [Malurus melanocephalus]|uniref:lymphotactin-like n=1 Tax=Malurus melanocephalus TaxID=175006 RepID=UPI00254671A5|nr:lymphotactin-like [Malurus melanocephalus]
MKLCTAAILLLFCLGIFTVHTAKGSASSQSIRKFSCLTLSPKQLNIRTLVSYQKQQVPTNAIMFITAKGIKICISPDEKWVKTAMKRIDERRAAKRK